MKRAFLAALLLCVMAEGWNAAEAATIRSSSGASASVNASAASKFQCLVSALDRSGYRIQFMGGYRRHGSVPHSKHPAGLALDINQYARNVTRPRIPGSASAMASRCGLFHGAGWRNADAGHFEVGGHASRHSRHRRYASHVRREAVAQ